MWWAMDETLFGHPKIVVHLRKIFVPAVANEGHDPLRFRLLAAIAQRRRQQRPSGGTAENPFARKKLPGHGKALLVVNLKRVRHVRHVGVFWNEIFTNAFD